MKPESADAALLGTLRPFASVNGVQMAGDPNPPRQGVLVEGFWTSATAKDCDFIPRPSFDPA